MSEASLTVPKPKRELLSMSDEIKALNWALLVLMRCRPITILRLLIDLKKGFGTDEVNVLKA